MVDLHLLSNTWVALINLACTTYCLLHVLLPKRFIHPLRLEISCREQGCEWKKGFWDRSEGDSMPLTLMDKMRNAHKKHYEQAHPGKEWDA